MGFQQYLKFKDKPRLKKTDKKEQRYNYYLMVDQDGLFFECFDGWNCEGGGGSIDHPEQDRFEIHFEIEDLSE